MSDNFKQQVADKIFGKKITIRKLAEVAVPEKDSVVKKTVRAVRKTVQKLKK